LIGKRLRPDNKSMAIYGQNYSYGYNPGVQSPYGFGQTPQLYGSNLGQLQGGNPVQQLMSTIQQLLGTLQQLQGAWGGIAGFSGYNPYQQQSNPYQQQPYNFTPYVQPVSFPGYSYPPSGPVVVDHRPTALSPAGMASYG
jgi:hypothetical protein